MKKQIIISLLLSIILLLTLFTLNSKAASSTMPDAVDGVITLTEDVELTSTWTVSETVTLDLAGYKVYTTTGLNGHVISVTSSGNLTIQDSVGGGTITNSYTKDNKGAIYNLGTVTINSGTFSLDTSVNNNTWYLISNQGIMAINGGTFISNDYGSSMIRNSGGAAAILTINSGTFDGGLNTIKNDENGSGVYGKLYITGGNFSNTAQHTIMNWATTVISGGTFNNSTSSAVIWNGTWEEIQADLSISGGTFKGSYILDGAIQEGNLTPVTSITGGTYNYDLSFLSTVNNNYGNVSEEVEISVTGGTYSGADVTPEYDEDVYMLLDNEDGTYTVVAKSNYSEDYYNIITNEDGSVSITIKGADYSKVEEAIKKAESLNKDDYKDFSAVEAAINAVVRGKNITEQEIVDAYAQAIYDAIDSLEKKESTDTEEATQEKSSEEKDETPKTGSVDIVLSVSSIVASISLAGIIAVKKYNK